MVSTREAPLIKMYIPFTESGALLWFHLILVYNILL